MRTRRSFLTTLLSGAGVLATRKAFAAGDVGQTVITIDAGKSISVDAGKSITGPGKITTTIASRETVLSYATLQATTLQNWFDGTAGIDKNGSAYTFWSPDGNVIGKAVGTLSNPITTSQADLTISGSPGATGYCAGGPIYRIDSSNILMLVHLERYPGSGYYTTLGMAKSSDNGASWTFLGEIISPTTTYAEYPICSCHFDLGSGPIVIVGSYMYIYTSDFRNDGSRQMITVARALLSDVLTAFASNTVTPFFKYHSGVWTEIGLGGLSSPLETANTLSLFHDVKWNSYIGKYVAVTMNAGGFGTPTNIDMLDSLDGLIFEHRQTLADEGGGAVLYPVLVDTGSNPNVLGQSFYVYFMYSVLEGSSPGTRWNDAIMARRQITFDR